MLGFQPQQRLLGIQPATETGGDAPALLVEHADELAETIAKVPADMVLIGSPIDLRCTFG